MSSIGYRRDIDGLRGIAVAIVVLYHLFPKVVTGGFVGVDIFFVISGYLITRITLLEVNAGTFSFLNFYGRRIKRLFPALLLVLSATLLAGWYILLPQEFQQLGKHSLSGSLFAANIGYFLEAGYFDRESELKPLLHLWSLGVEEQFYLLWPLALLLLVKLNRLAPVAILAVMLASFALNLLWVNNNPSAAFYLPVARFWGILLGASLAWFSAPAGKVSKCENNLRWSFADAGVVIGFILIGVALWLVSPASPFPGDLALLPTLGAVLLIHYAPASRLATLLLGNPCLVWLGLISYPLYLWHWPITTYLRLLNLGLPDWGWRLLALAVMLLLSWITYRWVEKPLTSVASKSQRPLPVVRWLLVSMLITATLGLLIWKTPLPSRIHWMTELDRAAQDFHYPGDKAASLAGNSKQSIVFIGDSFAQQIFPAVKHSHQQLIGVKPKLHFVTTRGCAPIPHVERLSIKTCLKSFKAAKKRVADSNVQTVVIVGSWVGFAMRQDYVDSRDPEAERLDLLDPDTLYHYFDQLAAQLVAWEQMGKRTFVIPSPPVRPIANPMAVGVARLGDEAQGLPVKTFDKQDLKHEYRRLNDPLIARVKAAGAEIIDPYPWFCDESGCAYTEDDGTPRFKDSTHLRASFVAEGLAGLDVLFQ